LINDVYSSSKAVDAGSARWKAIGSPGGAAAPVIMTGGSHLLGFGFLNLLDYTFSYVVLSLYVNLTCGPSLIIFS
jgi:hypothetical protein